MGWDEFTIGTERSVGFRVTPGDMEAFEQLSGDSNPLHTDPQFARELGFEDAVVYGALLVAKVSGLVGMLLPGIGGVWSGLRIDFRNPLYVGEQAELRGVVSHRSEATKLLKIKLEIVAGDRKVATGTVESVYRADD